MLSGCKNTTPRILPDGSDTVSTPDTEISDSPTPLPLFPEELQGEHVLQNEETQTQPTEPPEIWDVSDVDISEIPSERKLISFTFDDAPARTLENIFAVFADFNEENPDYTASATVFFNGCLFDSQTPHLLATACALGFELGNHTYSHLDLSALEEEKAAEEIRKTDELLEKADGKPYHLLRPPFGKIDDRIKAICPTPVVNWTIDTLDWTGVSEEAIYNCVLSQCFSGAIVLMHDGYPHTVSALKRLLPELKNQGYQVVSVSKMVKAHGCVFRRGKEYIRARKVQK